MGKSALAAKLMERYSPAQGRRDWENSPFAIDAAFVCKHNDSRRRDARQMLISIAYQLCGVREYAGRHGGGAVWTERGGGT